MQRSIVEAARAVQGRRTVALTGAGISVESGIPDFRGDHGLWREYDPSEYATLDAFLTDPHKSWHFYRVLGHKLQGKEPNPAHRALARLEQEGVLEAVITQNIDGLHQLAGSRRVVEVHGDHRHLHCLQCSWSRGVEPSDLKEGNTPECVRCGFPLKPNIVLYGEWVRGMEEVDQLITGCQALLVVGTSGEVYPVAGLPRRAKNRGALLVEFNKDKSELTRMADFFLEGKASATLDEFARELLGIIRRV